MGKLLPQWPVLLHLDQFLHFLEEALQGQQLIDDCLRCWPFVLVLAEGIEHGVVEGA